MNSNRYLLIFSKNTWNSICEIFFKLKFSKFVQDIKTLERFGKFLLIVNLKENSENTNFISLKKIPPKSPGPIRVNAATRCLRNCTMPHNKKQTLVPKTALELNAVKNSFQMIYCFFLHLFGFKLHNCNDANLVGP